MGDATKAKEVLGWTPKVGFRELVEMMYESDLASETEKMRRNRKISRLNTSLRYLD